MVALFGQTNWWMPGRLARLLRVPATAIQTGGAHGAEARGPEVHGAEVADVATVTDEPVTAEPTLAGSR